MPDLDLRDPVVRFLAAFCQFLPWPIVFADPSSTDPLMQVTAPKGHLVLIPGLPSSTPTLDEVDALVRKTGKDALLLTLSEGTHNPFRFDAILHSGKRTERYLDCRLDLAEHRMATLQSLTTGDNLRVAASGLLPVQGNLCVNHVYHMECLGRGCAALSLFTGSVLLRDEA